MQPGLAPPATWLLPRKVHIVYGNVRELRELLSAWRKLPAIAYGALKHRGVTRRSYCVSARSSILTSRGMHSRQPRCATVYQAPPDVPERALTLYLHYNTGLHISENGRNFSDLLETILDQSPQRVELSIIAHSVGGLVSRSACHYWKTSRRTWLNHLRKLVFLGTPHHGAPLEKGGNWIDIILGISPYSAPFSRLGKIRSCGVTDLRYGNVVDDDWKGRDRFEFSGDRRVPVPLPEGVQGYVIAATTGKESNKLGDDLIGDGLVTLSSALGRHKKAELNLLFPETHQWVGRNMNHMDLLSHPEVYATINNWLNS